MAGVEFVRKSSQEQMKFVGQKVPYLQFPRLVETGMVQHCFTTRLGGVSEGDCSSMNLSFTRGDKEENVLENFARICDALEVEVHNVVCTHQTHTTNVRRVTNADKGKGVFSALDYQDVDGLITDEPGLVLATFYADCVPLYFVDPRRRVIGLSHSGWKGTVNRMGQATIQAMEKEFGCNPQDLITAIGPSICQECYEVSEDVAEAFRNSFTAQQAKEILVSKGGGKFLLDLWRANQIILHEAGVKTEHIVTTDICTCCNSELLFSHRASQGKRGNLAAFLTLK